MDLVRVFTVLVTLLALAGESTVRADDGVATYYVQLIRGTDTNYPPTRGSKCVGPKLAATFQPVFKCKAFWEIKRQVVTVAPGEAKRVVLGNGREAEIDLRSPKRAESYRLSQGQVGGPDGDAGGGWHDDHRRKPGGQERVVHRGAAG